MDQPFKSLLDLIATPHNLAAAMQDSCASDTVFDPGGPWEVSHVWPLVQLRFIHNCAPQAQSLSSGFFMTGPQMSQTPLHGQILPPPLVFTVARGMLQVCKTD